MAPERAWIRAAVWPHFGTFSLAQLELVLARQRYESVTTLMSYDHSSERVLRSTDFMQTRFAMPSPGWRIKHTR